MAGSTPTRPGPDPGDSDRCPSCGALVTADAEWCGQCFTPLKIDEPSREDLAARVGIKIIEAPAGEAARSPDEAQPPGPTVRLTWPCPACDLHNAIELSFCARCGTSFATLMKADEETVHIEPREALRWSLIYPGMGHLKAGYGADGVARGALFTLSLIFLLTVLLSGSGSVAQSLMVGFYLLTTLLVYGGSAAEAYRIAAGSRPFASSRTLLWVTVALLLASIGLLALTATTAVRR